MADYRSTLTGTQMDSALLDMAEHNSEAYAVGERNGIAVASDDVTYHNNARYYAQIASSQIVGDASSAVRWDTDQSEVLTDAQKAVARNNINAASDSDVVKITSQTLTSAQQSQARANIMAGGSNDNLLDNWYFVGGGSQLGDGVFPINQRGQASYTGSTYTIDRWIIASSGITVTPNAGYIELSGTAGNNFSQVIAPEIAKSLYGKTVTVSALMYDGTILTGTGIFPARTASSWNYVGFVYGTDAALIIGTSELYRSKFFIQTQSASAKVCAVKLELGTVSTLANDVPPDFGEELRKCQRYLWIKTFSGNIQLGSGVALTEDQAIVSVVTPSSMRPAQNITLTANVLLVGNGQVATAAVTGINQYDNITKLTISSSGLKAYHTYSFFTTTETTMAIYAEL